jgi:Zn-dependent protease with chaperone function
MRFFDTLSAVVMTAGIAVGGYFGYFGFHDGMIKQAVDTTHVVLVTAVGPVSSPLFDVASWGPSVPVIVSPIGSIASPIDGIANTLITKHDKLEIERGNRQLIAFPTSMMEPRFVSALWLRPNIEVKSVAGIAFTDLVYVAALYLGGAILFCLGRWWFYLRNQPRLPAPEADVSPWLNVHPKFAPLVHRLETFAASSPRGYRRRLALACLLGHGYVLGMLVTVIAAVLASGYSFFALASDSGTFVIWFKLAFMPLIVLAVATGRSLWVRMPPAEGRSISRPQAPELYELIDRIRTSLSAPKIRDVLITASFEAGVQQVPRLGLLGWNKNRLYLGLPLMLALSSDQLKAIIAHELGHLARGDGSFQHWIHRMRITWAQLAALVSMRASWGTFLFRKFLEWYTPWFNAYAFAGARSEEYLADRLSATTTSPQTAAEALASIYAREALLDQTFWPGLIAAAGQQADPPFLPYSQMAVFFRSRSHEGALNSFLDDAKQRETDLSDTHPALSDRLAALGQLETTCPDFDRSSAEELLGTTLDRLVKEFDDKWWEENSNAWRERFDEVSEQRRRLTELHAVSRKRGLETEEQWELAELTEELHGPETAVTVYRAILDREPNSAAACFHLGRVLIACDHAEGTIMLDRAIELDEFATEPACELAHHYLCRAGRTEDAESYRGRAIAWQGVLQAANAERQSVSEADELLEHDLNQDQMTALTGQLHRYREVREAWLVRKHVAHCPKHPLYVLFVRYSVAELFKEEKSAEEQLDYRLANELEIPGDFIVFAIWRVPGWLKQKLRGLPGSIVSSRPRSRECSLYPT